jgi:hypothetical protein
MEILSKLAMLFIMTRAQRPLAMQCLNSDMNSAAAACCIGKLAPNPALMALAHEGCNAGVGRERR